MPTQTQATHTHTHIHMCMHTFIYDVHLGTMGDLYAYICARVCEYEICMYTYIHMRSRDLSHPQKHTRYCHTQTHTRYYQELGSAAYVESCLLIRGMFSSRSHTHTPTHTHTHTNTHTHTHAQRARTHSLNSVRAHAGTYTHACMHTNLGLHIYIRTHTHVGGCVTGGSLNKPQ